MKFRVCLPALSYAALVMAVPASAQQKPLSQDQVLGLVRNSLGDESGAKLVEQRGLDFKPSEEFLQTLRGAQPVRAVGPANTPADEAAKAEQEFRATLEAKQDLKTALERDRLAANLAPDAGAYRQNYERLSRLSQNPLLPAGTSGRVYDFGPGVSVPIPVYKPEPPYSDRARRAKYEGRVVLWIVVDSQGNVADVVVTKPLGLGLDEKAAEAVRTWKF